MKETKVFLKNNPESDKGNITTAMYKTTYDGLALDILNDSKCFVKINVDPTSTVQKANKIVSQLERLGHLTPFLAKTLRCYDGVYPKFYFLPKVQKPVLSLRPIITGINSPTSSLTKYLTDILTKAYDFDNSYYVKDSFQFTEFAHECQVSDNYKLVSLDVVSLFSSNPLEFHETVTNNKWEDIKVHCKIPKTRFPEIFLTIRTFLTKKFV